ncbi:MAG TPA: type II toxin-antitoxin system HicB family antitoxin [Caulobacteraceae bacterium]|nr:type II toxin-antitoxin system HicB family antitoxin [Caulobacteraceae bacterium]
MNFVGILDGTAERWGVRFPDLDGCVSVGSTPDEAIASATEVLRDVLAHKGGGGHDLPRARSLADVLASGELGPGETPVLIPALLDAGRSVRANVTFDAGLLAEIDPAAKSRALTRSAFLASAAREKIEARR